MLSTVSTGLGLASSRLSRGAALRVHAATESGNKKTATEQKVNETQQKAKETVNTAKSEVQSKLPKTNGAGLPDDLPQPEWLPEQAKPVIGFLNATDFDIQQTDLFKQYIKPKLDNPAFNNAFGWKPIPESVNGRAAMLGYLTLALTELIRQKSFLAQLSAGPQLVLGTLALLVVGSIVPLYRGVEEKDLKAYREQLTLPEGVFTESNERVHGRLAMAAIAVQLLIEMIKGGPLL